MAQNTLLGWIVLGKTGTTKSGCIVTSLQCSIDDELSASVRRFWEQEEIPRGPPLVSAAEQKCLDHFAATHTRQADGRYVVRIPLGSTLPDLSDTRRAALHMLQASEERFKRDPAYHVLYSEFMAEYEKLGHMDRVVSPLGPKGRPECFLPHHGVLKKGVETSKLRVVFNGSQKTRNGASLNSCLLVGPNLLPLLADVLTRWRRHRYVYVADVEKMYRQVLVHEKDRDLQRILWRDGETLQEFRLNTVTYRLACAPFLAIRTLRQLADDESCKFPRGAAVLRENVYVDDILAGASTVSETLESRHQLEAICRAGGFPLKKWVANHEALLADIPVDNLAGQTTRTWQAAESHATLGLGWRPNDDMFAFVIRSLGEGAVTKRAVLSQAAQLFDPLGWMSPVTIKAKCIIQAAWLKQVGWDDRLPDEDVAAWEALRAELPLLRDFRIPRWIGTEAPDGIMELHGFADASERAYAAVLYLRSVTGGEFCISLLQAKTKVAPLRQLSLPRLELCAASLVVALTVRMLEVLKLPISTVHLWTDSSVTLGWIQGHPGRWTTFVANRVAEIQRALPDARWHHVPGEHNPADCASRGVAPSSLLAHALWWQGPDFLKTHQWPPAVTDDALQDLPELRRRVLLAETSIRESELLTRYSNLHRLLRVTAWMRRWHLRWRFTRGNESSPLASDGLRGAEKLWIIHAQSIAYAPELRLLEEKRPLPGRSSLLKLSPFKDEEGLLRVGGRLKNSVLSFDERHPVILPPESHFSGLIVDALHRRSLHGGVQLTLGLIRQRFWLPRGRLLVRQHIHRCPTCVRWRAASPQPLMSSLPAARAAPCRPFVRTGVDYAGPILLRASKGRGHKSFKAFIAIFVCLSSRAVHLEVVSDYSTDAFLASFRRFTARRGTCREVFSDCGTNFTGADAQLRAMFRAAPREARDMADQLATSGTRWRFNPPSAPHFGGLWEAAVKSVKHHLRRVIGNATLTFEEMTTFFTQVQACLNSRPLQALSDDPDDLAALTPGHFLIGEPLCSLPEPFLEQEPAGRLNRWQLLQQMRDHWWRRWSHEYLAGLIQRNKWHNKPPNLEVGQLCLLRSELTPPSKWPLARITEVHPGDGGQIRVVSVCTATSRYTRPVVKIVLLPSAAQEKKNREPESANL